MLQRMIFVFFFSFSLFILHNDLNSIRVVNTQNRIEYESNWTDYRRACDSRQMNIEHREHTRNGIIFRFFFLFCTLLGIIIIIDVLLLIFFCYTIDTECSNIDSCIQKQNVKYVLITHLAVLVNFFLRVDWFLSVKKTSRGLSNLYRTNCCLAIFFSCLFCFLLFDFNLIRFIFSTLIYFVHLIYLYSLYCHIIATNTHHAVDWRKRKVVWQCIERGADEHEDASRLK